MSRPVKIAQRVGASETTLYTLTSGSGEFTYANFCNITAADLTIDMYQVNSGSTASLYLVKGYTVPGTGGNQADWRGLVTMDVIGETIKAIASGASIDVTGTAVEV